MSGGTGVDKESMSCCASCGVKEGDDTKLKNCAACHLVKYCGVKCQKDHRPKHKGACRRRVAELRDEILFRQPESSHLGDCPICFLPLPLDPSKSNIMTCCSKFICLGCDDATQSYGKLDTKCPFCRTPIAATREKSDKRLKDRAEMNDPVALCHLGTKYYYYDRDYQNAFKYFSKAVEVGDVPAQFQLGLMFQNGEGVEKDESKAEYHWEQAAIGGHIAARCNLGVMEWNTGHRERAAKHWIIATNLGHDESLANLKMAYKEGFVTKDDLAAALREHQAAVDATKSPQRELGEKELMRFYKRPTQL